MPTMIMHLAHAVKEKIKLGGLGLEPVVGYRLSGVGICQNQDLQDYTIKSIRDAPDVKTRTEVPPFI